MPIRIYTAYSLRNLHNGPVASEYGEIDNGVRQCCVRDFRDMRPRTVHIFANRFWGRDWLLLEKSIHLRNKVPVQMVGIHKEVYVRSVGGCNVCELTFQERVGMNEGISRMGRSVRMYPAEDNAPSDMPVPSSNWKN